MTVGNRAGYGALAVLLASLLWGTTGTAAAMAPEVSALTIGAAAMGIGGVLQYLVAARLVHRFRRTLAGQARLLFLSAVAVAVFPLAFYSSMRLAGVAVGTVITIGSAPPAAALIERIMDRAPLSLRWAVGTAIGLAGVLALAVARSGEGGGPATDAGGPLLGIGLGLLAGASYALYSWGVGRIIRTGVPSRAAMGATFGIGGLLLLPVLAVGGHTILASAGNMAAAAYLALVPMFVGYLLFGYGLAHVSASTATTISLAEPAAAAIIAVLVLRERLAPLGWVGVVLLFVSLAVTSLPVGATSPMARD